MRPLALAALSLLVALPALAQGEPLADRQIAWRSYSADRSARVRVFAADDDRRPLTVVVDDPAGNAAPVTDDAQYLADLIGREVQVDPTTASFVFRFTTASFAEGGADAGKTLLLKATFRRTDAGALGAPEWRVISSETLERLTDRALR